MVDSNNIIMLHRFRDITTFTAYRPRPTSLPVNLGSRTASTFDITATCSSRFLRKHSIGIYAAFSEICELERFQTDEVTFKVIDIGTVR